MRIIKRVVNYLFLISLLLSVFSLFYSFPLPKNKEVIEPIKQIQPIINIIETKPYIKEFSGVEYKITPYAAYEIYGLVVEQYDSENWLDITHKKDPAQTKDLCLVWGENIRNGVYLKGKFSHGEFTCFYKLKYPDMKFFNGRELTNNHLVPENEIIKNLTKKVKKGDQIYIKGTLVDYDVLDEEGKQILYRKTSTSMEDSNCEVVLVSDFKILKEADPLIKNAKVYLFKTLVISSILNFLLFFI